jgi:hypothetical protein
MSIRGRTVQSNQVVQDQVDFFQPDGFTRVVGLSPGNLVSQIFYSNIQQPWPLVSGIGVPDAQISAGYVYFNETVNAPGFYSVRFRPNSIGYWRNLLTYPVGLQITAQDFDVVQNASLSESGLHASFMKPSSGGDCGC